MAQEQFAGPEYFTEFDPKKFLRDMKIINEDKAAGKDTVEEAKAETDKLDQG